MTICRGTTVHYNGVNIYDCLTDGVDQEILYDKTGVDPIGIKIQVSVVGYVHLNANAEFGIAGSGDIVTTMKQVQTLLLTPRRNFTMSIGDQTWLACAPYNVERCTVAPAGVKGSPSNCSLWDIENGPHPRLQVLGIIGQHSIKVRFTINYTRPICDDPYAAVIFKGLLHLRFWIVDDIDCKDWMVTRTYQGRMRFYGNPPLADNVATHPNLLARAFAIPPLQWGFQRRSISINQDPSGLEAEFRVVDQEVWAVAPAPATDWEGHFEVTIPYGGVACESECRVTVRGGKMTPKWSLLRLAMQILDAKLRLTNSPQQYIPMVMSFSEPLNANEVTGYAKIKHVQETNLAAPVLLNVFAANANTWFKPFPAVGPGALNLQGIAPGTHSPYQFEHGFQGSSPDGSQIVRYAPNSLVGLLLPALQVSCCPIWLNGEALSGYAPSPAYPTGDYPIEEPPEVQVAESQTSPGEQNLANYSDSHHEWFYWNTKLTSLYIQDNGLKSFPRAQADEDGNTLSIVRMHAPTLLRQVRLEFVRTNAWPELPEPRETWTDGNGIEHVLLNWKLAPNAALLAADGKSDYRSVAMVMNYALRRPVKFGQDSEGNSVNEKFPVGRLPNRKEATDTTGNPFRELDLTLATKIFVDPWTLVGAT